jgi:cob(I)alamin adenosyltransferase
MEKTSKGLIQVYTGNGKGKTTAALGQAIRACGHGRRIIFIQFVKGIPTGEHAFVAKYKPFEIVQPSKGDCFSKNEEQLAIEAKQTLEFSRKQIISGNYDMVILDEIFIASSRKFITTSEILDLIQQKPDQVELILTGRNAPVEVVQRADLVTEMLMIKHPFNEGIEARAGVEF